MSEVIEAAVAAMQARFGDGIDGTACFVLEGAGRVVVDARGARAGAGNEDADVTLTAPVETFRAILEGTLSPTVAYMSGRLRIEGDMGLALRLAAAMG